MTNPPTQVQANPTAETGATAAKPNDPGQVMFEALLGKEEWKNVEEVLRKNVPLFLREKWGSSKLENYNPILFLDQSNQIGEEHADRVYEALCSYKEKRDILLIAGSMGGRIEPAYLISKNCKASAQSRFVVVIPRKAKSAATLLALGADEIHMGPMSELGPIDPQLGRIPALSLTNALQTVARLVTEYPGSADMFAKYLQSQLDLGILGYFERSLSPAP